ncbi:MAG: anaerobic sulfatase maturase [Syntrophobacteraceae bacterium]
MTGTPSGLSASGMPLSMPPAFQVITKPHGAACNLSCAYCFYLSREALYPGSSLRMTDELLESYIRRHIEAHRAPEITFSWQGGEPMLMGLDFFQRAVALQRKYLRPGTRIMNTCQTNATLLNGEWCRFFHRNEFLLGVSLDGPRAEHDAYRLDKGGAPTFDRVMAGIELLRKHQVEFNVLACIHAANADRGLEVYRFMRDEVRAPVVQFIPIVERGDGGEGVTTRSVTGRQYGEFLTSVFDEWVRRDVGRMFVQIFDVALGVWFGRPATLCVFAEACGDALALEHNGDLFSCDHFVDPGHKLGNIARTHLAELVASTRQRAFGLDKTRSLPRFCRECPVRFVCNGGCPKDRFFKSPDGEPGLNALCEGYRAFFTHIDRPMRIMAELLRRRRPPAGIMDTLSQ